LRSSITRISVWPRADPARSRGADAHRKRRAGEPRVRRPVPTASVPRVTAAEPAAEATASARDAC
jgi:hypothetical protein